MKALQNHNCLVCATISIYTLLFLLMRAQEVIYIFYNEQLLPGSSLNELYLGVSWSILVVSTLQFAFLSYLVAYFIFMGVNF